MVALIIRNKAFVDLAAFVNPSTFVSMTLQIQTLGVTAESLVFSFLQQAAVRLQKMGVDQWQYWLNPPVEKVNWVKDGLNKGEFSGVFQGEQCIGIFRLQYSDELYWGKQDKAAGYIHSLVIDESWKGKGVGKWIMNAVEQALRQKGIGLLRLDCNANSAGLCDYYTSLGFQKVGEVVMPLSVNNLYEKALN